MNETRCPYCSNLLYNMDDYRIGLHESDEVCCPHCGKLVECECIEIIKIYDVHKDCKINNEEHDFCEWDTFKKDPVTHIRFCNKCREPETKIIEENKNEGN